MSDQVISGNFTFTETSIEGVKIVDVKAYGDDRGYFMETYKRSDFIAGGIDCEFVQDNQSSSTRGVLRGLHFQIEHPQAKLVRVVSGKVFDVAVDLRKDSPTYGKWEGVVLSAENKRQFFIPRGFAHGFLVLSDTAEFCYKCDDVYHPNDEGGLMWNDPAIGIEWPALDGDAEFDPTKIILSKRSKERPPVLIKVGILQFHVTHFLARLLLLERDKRSVKCGDEKHHRKRMPNCFMRIKYYFI